MMLWWCVLACASAAAAQSASTRVVTIQQGPVRGFKEPNTDVYAFRSIPYATGPTGPNRYKAPLPPPTWTEIFDAINKGIVCPQPLPPGMPLQMKEDCLIVNVYVPDTEERDLPVMVTVHGGAFQVGLGESERVVTMVDNSKKIIAVNFNYRLGAHGFLCLGNEEAPGNAGMKDQVALLRWVQRNIAAFGGNPNDVTVSGCSAGGASVDLLRLSSITDGLFKKVIVSSGGNAGSFGIQHDPLANAKYYATALDFEDVEDISALTDFYTTSTLDVLLSQFELTLNRHDSTIVWGPCIERDVGVERFLDDAPVNILKKGEHKHFPILYGFANMEGLMRVPFFDSWSALMNNSFSSFLPGDLEFENDEERETVATAVREFYFKDEDINERNILTFIDYFTDVLFGYSMLRSVKLNAEHGESQIYLYKYSFTDESWPIIPHTNVSGADHCQQYSAVLDGDETNITSEYQHMRAVMRQIFLDFIITGNPVSENSTLDIWTIADGNRSPHMNLDFNSTMLGALLPERAQLWDSVYEAHYRTPIPPPPAPGNAVALRSFSFLWIIYLLVLDAFSGR